MLRHRSGQAFVFLLVAVVGIAAGVAVAGTPEPADDLVISPQPTTTTVATVKTTTTVALREVSMFVLGDSYSTSADPWHATVAARLRAEGVDADVTVDAIGGSGYINGDEDGESFTDRAFDAPATDVAVVFGSRNDVFWSEAEVYDAAVATFAELDAERLLVIGPPWPTADVPASALAVRDALERAAGDAGAVFFDPIDAGWFADTPDLIGPDGVHPTSAGQAYMAERILPLVADLVD